MVTWTPLDLYPDPHAPRSSGGLGAEVGGDAGSGMGRDPGAGAGGSGMGGAPNSGTDEGSVSGKGGCDKKRTGDRAGRGGGQDSYGSRPEDKKRHKAIYGGSGLAGIRMSDLILWESMEAEAALLNHSQPDGIVGSGSMGYVFSLRWVQ